MIRPFVYVRERDLNRFAKQVSLPIIPENCPACFTAPKVSATLIKGIMKEILESIVNIYDGCYVHVLFMYMYKEAPINMCV